MTKEEISAKNMVLGIEFDKYLIEHPEAVEEIPDDGVVVLLPEEDKELVEENLKLAEKYKQEGKEVVYVRVKKMAPYPKSRLVEVSVSSLGHKS